VLLAKVFGFLDPPNSFQTAMAILCSIWLVVHVVLLVVITGVGRQSK
jgi:hypothetical protein